MMAPLSLRWSEAYHPEWDATPDAYVEAGVVAPEHTRRLLRADDAAIGFKAYLVVRHSDPSRWGAPGEPRADFYLSALLGKTTIYMHRCQDVPAALLKLRMTHAHFSESLQRDQ